MYIIHNTVNGAFSTILILNFLPSAPTTKRSRRPRPKPKTTSHPEVPHTMLGKYVICGLKKPCCLSQLAPLQNALYLLIVKTTS
jgi:hypothetical protein